MYKQSMADKLLNKSFIFIKRHSPLILSCLGSIGVVATAVLSAKATPKAVEGICEKSYDEETETFIDLNWRGKFMVAWKYYIPMAIVGLSTIGCIIGSNIISGKHYVALGSAYALISNQYKNYQEKVKEIYGQEAHRRIMEALCVEKAKDDWRIKANGLVSSSLEFEDANEEPRLFYDSFSQRYFETTISRILQAEYHLNRNCVLRGAAALNEFYDFLGIDKVDYGYEVGWNTTDGIMWIDFNHQKAVLDDGLECYIVSPIFPPDSDYLHNM